MTTVRKLALGRIGGIRRLDGFRILSWLRSVAWVLAISHKKISLVRLSFKPGGYSFSIRKLN